MHRYGINSLDLSLNGGYMLTGGADHLLKVWDYDAQKSIPYFFQAFIGHSYPLTKAIFNPNDNNTIISIGGDDGIYIWQFHGDTQTNYFEEDTEQKENSERIQFPTDLLHEPTQLEKMRTSVREKKTPKLKELCFNLPQIFALKNDLNDVSRKMQGLSKIAQSLL